MKLLLENNVVSPTITSARNKDHGLLLSDAKEIKSFFTRLKHPNLGLLLDVGHAKVSATALGFNKEDFLEEIAEFVDAFHLSENDGYSDSNELFNHDAWFSEYLSYFPEAVFIIEVYRISQMQIRNQYQILNEILAK